MFHSIFGAENYLIVVFHFMEQSTHLAFTDSKKN